MKTYNVFQKMCPCDITPWQLVNLLTSAGSSLVKKMKDKVQPIHYHEGTE